MRLPTQLLFAALAALATAGLVEWQAWERQALVGAWLACASLLLVTNASVAKVYATGLAVYCAYMGSIYGRTMNAGLSAQTTLLALFYGVLCGGPPTLCVARFWPGSRRKFLALAILPNGMGVALTVAAIEECVFVNNHSDGAPLTARATVPSHDLGYDAERDVLWGND